MILLTLKVLLLLICSLVRVAFITLLERKVLSLVGLRLGPNKVSFFGLLQPMGDAIKLSNKQVNSLSNFSFFFYYLRASIIFIMSTFIWFCYFHEPVVISFKLSFLIFFLVLGLNSLNSILCGWRTFSKFSLVGRLRTVAQLISYEAVLYLCIFFVVFTFISLRISFLFFFPTYYAFILLPFVGLCWLPSFLAELNRTPYDFSEGESELVRGFNTEFGSSSFTLIFLAEYRNIIFFCIFSSFLFLYSDQFLFLCFSLFLFFVIWIRSVLPRYRFDKLIILCWKFFVPFLTCYFLIYLRFNI